MIGKPRDVAPVGDSGVVIEGYDPLFVAFIDETSARSYPTSAWEYDFGDEIVYGMLPGERKESVGAGDDDYVSIFQLPGDKELLALVLSAGSNSWLNGSARDTFDLVSIMNPRLAVGWIPGRAVPASAKFITYPSADDVPGVAGDLSRGMRHITSFSFSRSSDGDSHYSGSNEYKVSTLAAEGEWRFVDYFPTDMPSSTVVYRRPVEGARIVVSQRGSDDCSRGGLCEQNTGDGSTVGHIYKGPGIYTATLRQKSSSPRSTVGQIPDDGDFSGSGMEYAVATIVVHPTCPCVETHILGKMPGEDASPKPGAVYQCVLSSDEYSADNPGYYGNNKSFLDYAPKIFQMYDSERNLIFDGVSGYAPFVLASTKTTIRQSSIPVSGIRIETGDWYTDAPDMYTDFVSKYNRGWPVWEPSFKTGSVVGWEDGRLTVTERHTYVMPGIYKPSVHLEYSTDRTRREFVDEMEECTYPTNPVVMVKEIPPKTPSIRCHGASSVNGVTTMEFSFSARAGSYPICDVVWDFDDGTRPMKLSRNIDDGYVSRVIVGDRTTAEYVGPDIASSLNLDGLDYGSVDWGSVSAYASNTGEISYPSGVYPEFDPRDWRVYHEYTRTAAEDRYQYVVSAIGYVCNTETMTLATYVTSAHELKMPDFADTEGEVKLIDARTFEKGDEMVMTLEGDNGRRTTLYNIKWDGGEK